MRAVELADLRVMRWKCRVADKRLSVVADRKFVVWQTRTGHKLDGMARILCGTEATVVSSHLFRACANGSVPYFFAFSSFRAFGFAMSAAMKLILSRFANKMVSNPCLGESAEPLTRVASMWYLIRGRPPPPAPIVGWFLGRWFMPSLQRSNKTFSP